MVASLPPDALPISPRPFHSALFFSGLAVWLLGLTFWGALWTFDRPQAIAAGATLGGFLVAGKIVGITAGLTLHGRPLVVAMSVFVPDFGAVLFFHPFSQVGIERLGTWNRWFGGVIARARERHTKRDGFIARHGAWGLFLLALVPVGFYSPLVIAAIGEIAGLRPRYVVAAVGSAIGIMTGLWLVAIQFGLTKAGQLDPRLPLLVGISITLLFVGKNLLGAFRRRATITEVPAPTPGPSEDETPRNP